MSSPHKNCLLLYKLLKENKELLYNSAPFKKKARLFSIPIFNRILLLLTFSKMMIEMIYFFLLEKTIKKLPVFISFILFVIVLCIINAKHILKIKLVSKMKFISEYEYTRLLRIIYLFLFFFQENYVIYYYHNEIFEMNPGYIFFNHVITFYFESSDFSTGLFYLYILNLANFVYFASLDNFLNFLIPIVIVIGIFILIEAVGHSIGKKLTKYEIYFAFFERILNKLSNEEGIKLTYNSKLIYPLKLSGIKLDKTEDNTAIDSQSDFSFDQDLLNPLDNTEQINIPVEGFDGFEIVLNRDKGKSQRKQSFMINLEKNVNEKTGEIVISEKKK